MGPVRYLEQLYEYFPDELALARELGLSVRVFCEDASVLPTTLAGPWVECAKGMDPDVFMATDYKHATARNEAAKDLVEHFMGGQCLLGREFSGGSLRVRLVKAICEANVVFADIACRTTETGQLSVNVNACVEAGAAMASKRPLFLSCLDPTAGRPGGKKTESVPFFFRDHSIEW